MTPITDTETLLLCSLWVIILAVCCVLIILRTPNK